ncbi:MAG: hypothetical protein SNG14_05190 [Rikenellaceae bacterium]
MKRVLLTAVTLITATINATQAQESAAAAVTLKYGTETTPSSYFEERYHYNNLVHYLDNQNLHITYQAETTGEYNQPDRMIFSVDGNSYRWNRYYLDGFRIDSRYFAGSTLYTPNMGSFDLGIDYINSAINFTTASGRSREFASLSYNFGGLGGISTGTEAIIHLFHLTATDRAYKPIEERNSIKRSGSGEVNFALKSGGGDYMQSLMINFGQRYMVGFGSTGIESYYPESYGKVQLNGELPLQMGSLFDKMDYIAIYSQRDHMNSEFYYSEAESPALKSYSASLFGSKRSAEINYTSGFNVALNSTEHEDINFTRNLIDHDSEGFEPWMPDGNNLEISHSITLNKQLNDWLTLSADCYNTLMHFNPSLSSFHNATYKQLTTESERTMLYLYEWETRSFYSGLLENSAKLHTLRHLSDKIDFRADLGVSLDALLVSGNSKLSPNIEARAGFDFNPTKWLNIELNLSRERVSYNIEDIRFLSSDYLSGKAYFINDKNGNGAYDSGEKGDLFVTTGGEYHTLSSSAKQPTYYTVDIPITIKAGRHTISLLQSYRKYCNTWTTSFEGDSSDYGYTQTFMTAEATEKNEAVYQDLFFFDGGKEINYTVGDYPDGIMGDGFFTSTPFYFCSNVEYRYTTPKFLFTINWQSYMMSGLSTLGSGPLHNNLGALSESSANPNTTAVVSNAEGKYPAVGRLDQDRAYVARIFASYNINERWQVATNLKFKDGQPFSIYHTETVSSGGNNQMAILPKSSRGINTTDGNFGTREDAIFNIDLRVKYLTTIAKRRCEIGAYCYNIYDFGNELSEYAFDQDVDTDRAAMSLTIPRGLIFSFKMDL